jgi:hypothetical protein
MPNGPAGAGPPLYLLNWETPIDRRVYDAARLELYLTFFGKGRIAPLSPLVNSAAAGDSRHD